MASAGGSGPAGLLAEVHVGDSVEVALRGGARARGIVAGVDRRIGSLALREPCPESDTRVNIRLIRQQHMEAAPRVIERAESRPEPPQAPDAAALADRADAAAARAAKAMEHMDPEVSARGRALFEVISSTFDCRWEGDVLVMGHVRVSPPYNADSCAGGTEHERTYARQMIRGQMERLARRDAAGLAPSFA